MTENEKTVSFKCIPEKNLFFKDTYKIYSVKVDKKEYPNIILDSSYHTAKIVGSNIYELEMGKEYEVVAIPKSNPKYGISYEVISISRDEPKTIEDIKAFLMTILTYGQAQQIMEHYPNIIDLIKEGRDNEIDLNKLKGIGEKSFEKIKEKILNNFQLIDMCSMFYNMISLNMMKKLYSEFGSAEAVKENLKKKPYSSLYKIDRVGFKKSDEILLKIEEESNRQIENGEEPKFKFDNPLRTSPDRCLACMEYYLEMNEQEGNTKMPIEDLKAKVKAYVKETFVFFNELINEDCFHYDMKEQAIGLITTYNMEKYIANRIVSANKKPILWDVNLCNYTKIGDFELTEEQQNAQKFLCKNNVVILNGPAGSGKSSSIKSLTNMLIDHHLTFNMAAPSAKAAKVLSRYAGYEATTIHRMLGYQNGAFIFNKDNPITSDVVIIDETSMLDVWLMVSLLKAIDFDRTKLLLVGDSYQLPSVGAGNLFYDLIQSKICPISTLSKIFRYSEGGLIKVATDIRNSKQYLPSKIDLKKTVYPFGNSYYFCPQSKEHCIDYVVKMYCKLAEKNSLENIMVITAQNKGEFGTVVLNNRIQNAINPNKDKTISYKTVEGIEIEYRLNDIVMQTVNDYHSIVCDEYGYFERDEDGSPMREALIANGENGRIVYINSIGMVVRYDDYYIWRTKSDLDKLSLGYAITCHKSQGSGCDNVIILTPAAHTWMVNSNLLYVSCTRAKSKCYHIGSLITINSAVKKKANLKRTTFLQELLKEEKELQNG